MERIRSEKAIFLCGTGTALLAAILLHPCVCRGMEPEETLLYTNTDFAMDTVVSQTLYTTGEDITDAILEILTEVENEISWTRETSSIYRINKNGREGAEVSPKMAEHLKQVLKLSEASGGAVDPTLGEVIRLWEIGSDHPRVPEEEELSSLLEKTGYEKVLLKNNTVILEDDCTLDLGAVGKGLGCDAAAAALLDHPEVEGFLLNLGGSSVMTCGEKPDWSPWRIAVTDPRDEGEEEYLGVVTLEANEFLSTSGDYEKYFITRTSGRNPK